MRSYPLTTVAPFASPGASLRNEALRCRPIPVRTRCPRRASWLGSGVERPSGAHREAVDPTNLAPSGTPRGIGRGSSSAAKKGWRAALRGLDFGAQEKKLLPGSDLDAQQSMDPHGYTPDGQDRAEICEVAPQAQTSTTVGPAVEDDRAEEVLDTEDGSAESEPVDAPDQEIEPADAASTPPPSAASIVAQRALYQVQDTRTRTRLFVNPEIQGRFDVDGKGPRPLLFKGIALKLNALYRKLDELETAAT
ncbi:MAG: hypothetical protein IT190_09740, partial [Microbacteriaceae bacterium]|nr:hypothetical protein [Microbacteriaceae bacterium]